MSALQQSTYRAPKAANAARRDPTERRAAPTVLAMSHSACVGRAALRPTRKDEVIAAGHETCCARSGMAYAKLSAIPLLVGGTLLLGAFALASGACGAAGENAVDAADGSSPIDAIAPRRDAFAEDASTASPPPDVDGATAAGCSPLAPPPDAAPAGPLALYPAPRFAAVATLGATVTTACVDTSALSSHAALDALVPALLAEASLKSAAYGSCSCDWSIRFVAKPPPLTGSAHKAWTTAGSNAERFLVTSATADDGRAMTTAFAAQERSALWALRASLESLQKSRVPGATIIDWPAIPRRGIVEGIYGPSNANADCAQSTPYWLPYRVQDRNELVRLQSRLRMNAYLYGPKCDVYSGPASWRTPYPVGAGQVVATAAHEAARNLIDFGWAVRPLGLLSSGAPYATELATLRAKLETVRALGVSHFALFWDDSTDYGGTLAQQITLMNDVDAWVKSHDPSDHLTIVGQPYCGGGGAGSFCSGPDSSTAAYGAGLHADIEVFWTGSGVEPPTMTAADLTPINASLKRSITVWDNWPCSGASSCGPPGFHGRSADLAGAVRGYYANPVLNEYLGPALPLESFLEVLGPIADFTGNPDAYAASTASEDASYARWKASLPKIEPKVGGTCTPCAKYGAYWTCNSTDPKTLEFCDPVTKCLVDVPCAGGCRKEPDPNPDVCVF